jgi:repressor LexA
MVLYMRKELTTIQRNILDFLLEQKSLKGYPPTLAEIAEKFGYKNRATVKQHLESIERKGYIKKNPRISRGIEITLEEKLFTPRSVLGEVAAGNPLTIYPDSIDTVEIPTLTRMPSDSFLLKVKGDSLKDAFILNGDLVIVNPRAEAANGLIVVAILDDAAVVKRYYRKKDIIELLPENPEYNPIIINSNYQKFKLVGVVTGIYRTMFRKSKRDK